MSASCAACGTHTGTHWSDCPYNANYNPNYGKPNTPATRLEDAKVKLDKANAQQVLAQRKYDEALAEFKKEYEL